MNGIDLTLMSMDQDADAATDQILFRDNITWSKGRLKRAKVMSMITGNRQPSRKKIFSEVRNSEDIQIWSIDVHGKLIRCAKVSNPLVLTKSGSGRPTWSELADVQRLEIEDPEATLSTVPKHVTDLRHLESLSVTWTKIRSLPPAVFQLPLNSLYLQRNHIKTLNGIEKASQLTILDISNNQLDSLPRTFGQLRSLITLNLSGNGLQELPDSVGSMTQLKTLDCSCNKLKSLPLSLGNIIELTSLDVSTNHLTSLPESIGSLPKLEDLRVRSNQLTSLPNSFDQLMRLNSLLLRNNKFEEVPIQLEGLTNLQSLNMRENMISHMDRPINPLRYLILDKNYLKQIDVGILQCPNLQYLSLRSNSIVEVTGSISKLANIRSLDLSDNAISEVPAGLDRLTHLRHLSICSTKIKTIPLAVASMPNLSTLELEDCSELDGYLNIAYKTNGLPGVIEYLEKNAASIRREPSVNERSDDKVKSLYPEEAILRGGGGNKSSIRKVAGLSIVPGTSVSPPTSEAMLQVDSGSAAPPKLVHVARQSLCPTERPAKPQKPSGLAQSVHQQDQSWGVPERTDESTSVISPTHSVAESPSGFQDSEVIATLSQFGDLTSSSTPDTIQQQQQQQPVGDDGETAARRDTVKKRDETNPLLGGDTSQASTARKPSTKVPPPVMKKPHWQKP